MRERKKIKKKPIRLKIYKGQPKQKLGQQEVSLQDKNFHSKSRLLKC